MANQYIDYSYVDHHLGPNVREALFRDSGGVYMSASCKALISSATAIIETALRNSGYATPTATISQATAIASLNEYVKLATFGQFYELAAKRPEKRLRLPEDWATNPAKVASEAILSGDANLTLTLDTSAAVGGWQASENSDSVSSADGSRSPVFSRKNLAVL
jgi:hypothetical protein